MITVTDPKARIFLAISCLLLLIGGVYLIAQIDYRIAAGVFLMIWANNISLALKE